MNIFYLIFGILAVILGLSSLFAYITKNEKLFLKKKRMTEFWGRSLGIVIHFIGYVIVPIAAGLFLIIRELL